MTLTDPKVALAHKMAAVARGWRRLADAMLADMGVSSSAGWCLVHIDALDGATRQTDLARALEISQPSLARTLDRMEAADLILRVADPDDRRSNIVGLTPAGQALAGRIAARIATVQDALLTDVPDGAIEIANWLCDRLTGRMAEQGQLAPSGAPERG